MATGTPHHAKSTKHGRKIGRNKAKCERYTREGRRDYNKARRTKRIVAKHSGA